MLKELIDEKRLMSGSLVSFIGKNKLGVISELTFIGAKCWFQSNNEKQSAPYELLIPLSVEEATKITFINDYAKASLIERHLRIKEDREIPDLITYRDVREEVKKLLSREE